MNKKKLSCLMLTLMVSLSMLAGCGSDSKKTVEQSSKNETETTIENSNADSNETAANQLLQDLTGTYQELWPVVLADEYRDVWLEDTKAIVGEENAQAAVDKMQSMVTGTVIGEDAVAAYADGNMAYDCAFTQGISKFTFDGNTISGVDSNGKEVFSHTYHYVGMEEIRGLYEYESDDAESGEFTYFCLAPDTMDTTYHIEFRYGSDLETLGKYDAGEYAYWLASGISTDHTEEDAKNSIQIFCTENLTEQ